MRTNRASLCARIAWYAAVAYLLFSTTACGSELRGTKDFADVVTSVESAVQKYGAEHVLPRELRDVAHFAARALLEVVEVGREPQ